MAIIFVGKLAIVQEALNKNETLIGAIFCDLLLDKLNDQVLVVVHGRVLTFFIWIYVLNNWSEFHGLGALGICKSTA